MKKFLCLALSLLMVLTLFAGCAKDGAGDTTPAGDEPADTADPAPQPEDNSADQTQQPAAETVSGVVNTDGSTSMADVMAVLQETFKELHPDVTVNYSGTGSGAGIEAAHRIKLGALCREHHHREVFRRGVFAQSMQYLKPVNLRKHDVEQNEFGKVFFARIKKLGRGRKSLCLESGLTKRIDREVADVGIVFNVVNHGCILLHPRVSPCQKQVKPRGIGQQGAVRLMRLRHAAPALAPSPDSRAALAQ